MTDFTYKDVIDEMKELLSEGMEIEQVLEEIDYALCAFDHYEDIDAIYSVSAFLIKRGLSIETMTKRLRKITSPDLTDDLVFSANRWGKIGIFADHTRLDTLIDCNTGTILDREYFEKLSIPQRYYVIEQIDVDLIDRYYFYQTYSAEEVIMTIASLTSPELIEKKFEKALSGGLTGDNLDIAVGLFLGGSKTYSRKELEDAIERLDPGEDYDDLITGDFVLTRLHCVCEDARMYLRESLGKI